MSDEPQPPAPPPTALPVTFAPGPTQVLTVELSDADKKKVKKQRAAEAVAEARALNSIGAKVLQVKNKTFKKLGSQLEDLGVRKIAHGRIAISGQNADLIIARCDEIIRQSIQNNPAIDIEAIALLIRLQLEANSQSISIGKTQLESTAIPSGKPVSNNLSMPLPPGASARIDISQPKTKAIEAGSDAS